MHEKPVFGGYIGTVCLTTSVPIYPPNIGFEGIITSIKSELIGLTQVTMTTITSPANNNHLCHLYYDHASPHVHVLKFFLPHPGASLENKKVANPPSSGPSLGQ